MEVVEDSTEVLAVVGGSTAVLRASTAFSVLPLTPKSRVVFISIGFDQRPSLQSDLCWTRRGDGNVLGFVMNNVRSFHSQHKRRVLLVSIVLFRN